MAPPVTSTLIADLTPPQKEAVLHRDGPMLVVAGAGSGKTRVVTRRIAYLIHEGVAPTQILALTFTNKAAGEMKRRVADLVGATPPWVGTFHSVCARFLRCDIEHLACGRDRRFTILDEDDQQAVIKECIKALGYDVGRMKPPAISHRISKAKSQGCGPSDFYDAKSDSDQVAGIYRAYEERLRSMNAVDFDDLLLLTTQLLEKNADLLSAYHRRHRYLLIDEYQDTNRLQYIIARLLAGPQRNIHATGDPDQSIYSWRGADYRNIMDFQKDFPGTRLVRLEENYRSTSVILSLANHIIRHNTERIDKDLFTSREGGVPASLACLDDERQEALYIARRIARLRAMGMSLRQVAVLYRINAQSRPLEEALMSVGLPYQIVGGVRFYERREIKDLLAHLKLLVNPRDTMALRRILHARPTGVGDKTIDRLEAHSRQTGTPIFELLQSPNLAEAMGSVPTAKLKAFSDWCRRLAAIPFAPVTACVRQALAISGLTEQISAEMIDDPAAEARLENLSAFVNRAAEFEMSHPDASLADFLEDVALVADIDQWDDDAEAVNLMTLHSVKGLEFTAVFICGLEQGLLPHQNAMTKAAVEEERRLFYVGITRAQENLYLTFARSRMLWGQTKIAASSVFLAELPRKYLALANAEEEPPFPGGLAEEQKGAVKTSRQPRRRRGEEKHLRDEDVLADMPEKSKAEKSAVQLCAGDKVEHGQFGQGKVLIANRREAMVHFPAYGTRLLRLDRHALRKISAG